MLQNKVKSLYLVRLKVNLLLLNHLLFINADINRNQ